MNELGAFIVEQMRVFRCKTPAAEFLLERFRIVRLLPFRQSCAGRRPRVGVLDRNNASCLALNIQLLLNFARPIWQFELIAQVEIAAALDQRIDPFTGWPHRW